MRYRTPPGSAVPYHRTSAHQAQSAARLRPSDRHAGTPASSCAEGKASKPGHQRPRRSDRHDPAPVPPMSQPRTPTQKLFQNVPPSRSANHDAYQPQHQKCPNKSLNSNRLTTPDSTARMKGNSIKGIPASAGTARQHATRDRPGGRQERTAASSAGPRTAGG
jgi:hypothetical protein